MKKNYFIYGEQSLEREEAIKKILDSFNTDCELITFDMESILADKNGKYYTSLNQEIKFTSFFGAKCILIKNFHLLPDNKKFSHISSFFIEAIEFHKQRNAVTFIFEASTEKTSSLPTHIKRITSDFNIIATLTNISKEGAKRWLIQRAAHKKIPFTEKLAETLIEKIGINFNFLDNELQKIYLLTSQSQKEEEVLDKIASYTNHFGIFDYVDAFFQKNVAKLDTIISKEIPPFIALVVSQLRYALKTRSFLKRGENVETIAQKTETSTWRVKKSIQQTKLFTIKEIEQLIVLLGENDVNLKFSSYNPAKFHQLYINAFQNTHTH